MSPRAALLVLPMLLLLVACDEGNGRFDTACTSNDDCAPDELCGTNLCTGGVGACEPRPESCEPSTATVCGCDGITYESQCFASLEGVRLASTGACLCASNDECLAGQYCALDDSCGNPGSCVTPPEECDPEDTQQVCGCDGMTYDNECAAAQAGVRVSALGSCNCDGNDDCPSTDYCNAIVCDGPGVCESRTGECNPDRPVTGCDGDMYDDDCAAAEAGVRVRPS